MLDLELPLELDDGREVVFERLHGSRFYASIEGTPYRNGQYAEAYKGKNRFFFELDGTFGGGNKRDFYYVQNAGRPEMYVPEDWS